ncbi:hypothetical protein SRB5_01480 [Streptomyces sp. RB5]|uniref:Membrane lipoprotein n=1 Tax=Streptomyces smaragdinus TaxID=2585196 RepID=A0A7K0CB86_9ACTN|nr:hypothetical protein [Streptomyces smaragdinus]MQY10044.1 hypothetical protein [Streptomyces smaragdinus]
MKIHCVVLVVGALALAGCGTKSASSGNVDRSELEARARDAQVAIENVYVTEVADFDLAEQSVGVLGADGWSAIYVREGTGAQIRLGVDRRSIDKSTCPDLPVGVGTGGRPGAVECAEDDGSWYRVDAAQHEYATGVDGRVVRVNADLGAVDRDTLREAARAAHPASDAELDEVLPQRRDGGGPVERGDLPAEGDGAPDNGVGVGG